MRFMMLMIPKGYEKAAPGTMPDAKAVEAMMKYNEALQKAGVLLSLDGLHPLSMGARVSFSSGKPKVTDGPFIETKEILGGYCGSHLCGDQAGHFPRRALAEHEGAAGEDLPPRQRPAQSRRLVALGEKRPRDEENPQRCSKRQGRRV